MENWRIGKFIAAFIITGFATTTYADTPAGPARGELLYHTHCQFCHNEAVHWRDKSLVTDWNGLIAQVNRWQKNINLNWNADDVFEVASYLNSIYYHFPESGKKEISMWKM